MHDLFTRDGYTLRYKRWVMSASKRLYDYPARHTLIRHASKHHAESPLSLFRIFPTRDFDTATFAREMPY